MFDALSWVERFVEVRTWPAWARRTFLLTLPISGPIWLVVFGFIMIIFIALALLGYVVIKIVEIWTDEDIG